MTVIKIEIKETESRNRKRSDEVNNIIASKKMHKKMNNNKNIRCSVVNFIFLFNFDILDFRFEEKNNNKNNFKFLKLMS